MLISKRRKEEKNSMNQVVLIGRLTKDVDLRFTQSNTAVCQFSIAVDRKYKSEGQPTADFISVVAWKQTAEFIAKYFHKGNRIALTGRIQTRSWEDDNGQKRYATEVIAESVEFCESKQQTENDFAKTEAGYYDGDTPTPAPKQDPQEEFFVIYDDPDCPF